MSVLHLGNEDFKSTIEKGSGLAVVDFYADWCMPCKMFAPILEKVAQEAGDKATFAKVNVDQAEGIALQYGVMSIPTIILFKDGKEVQRRVGALSRGELLSLLEL